MKKKLKINELKVKSFVTELDTATGKKFLGASGECVPSIGRPCLTPAARSKDFDCPFTRINDLCVQVAVTGIC